MENKRDSKFIIVPILVFLVFVFALIGYKQLMGPGFSYSVAIYSTLYFFILNNITPQDAGNNGWLLLARYLAALLLGVSIYNLVYSYFYRQYRILKIKWGYSDHVVVFSTKIVGTNFIYDLLNNHYKVILVEESTSEDSDIELLERKGVIVFKEQDFGPKLFDTLQLAHARACIIAFAGDTLNIGLSLKVIEYLREADYRRGVRLLTHIEERNSMEVIKDYIDISAADENFEQEIFNLHSAAAKKVYDQYPPHEYLDFQQPGQENALAIVGYNITAEDFIIENIILSHYKGCHNIKIYLVDKDADTHLNHFIYKYPFSREFVDIVPVKLLNNKFFANFSWSKELIERLSQVKAAYFFGNEGAELINMATRFRQFLSGQVDNYLKAPIVICFPEDTGIMNLLNAERVNAEKLSHVFRKQMNIQVVNMVTDTCTSTRLLHESEYIDTLARVVNYYYAVKYELADLLIQNFHVKDPRDFIDTLDKKILGLAAEQAELTLSEIEKIVTQSAADYAIKPIDDMKFFSIKKCWDRLTYHKKSSNRYAARHLAVKINIMKNIGCLPLTHENIINSFPVIAPVEHKRWAAEKMVLNYRYGALPKDKIAKNIAKDVLKIHDLLVPYEKLDDHEQRKDLNIFLLMPLLNSLKVETKR